MGEQTSRLSTYVPVIACSWDAEASGSAWQSIDGTLLFVDISGFTNLSEKLAAQGRVGAEELTSVLNNVFGRMLDIASARNGSLLKFGGDALLMVFRSEDHVVQACAAAVEMRDALKAASEVPTSVGRIPLKMSSGIHTGPIDFFLVGDSHRELVVAGPNATLTTEMEEAAEAGEIVVSDAVRDLLPGSFTSAREGSGWRLSKRKIDHPFPSPVANAVWSEDELVSFVPRNLRDRLIAGIRDSEHRVATIGFLGFSGVDELIRSAGADRAAEALDALVCAIQIAADDESITFLASDVAESGGKVILSAGVPSRQSDDEGSVLRAFRRILDFETPLDVRGGIHTGHVFAGEIGSESRSTFSVIGDTVNLAARMMTAAPVGSLYASPSVLDRAATLFRTEQVEAFSVKGKDQKVPAYLVFEETGIRPVAISHELPFGGRDPELQMLVAMVETCTHEGSGGMMTITGDTGTGKSRLIAEVLRKCPGMGVLTIQAEPNGTDNTYWAFRDPMRAMLGIARGPQAEMSAELDRIIRERDPELVDVLPLIGDVLQIEIPDNGVTAAIDPQFRAERTGDAVVALLDNEAKEQLAVVAEDGHWMDEASISLLRRIGEAAESRPWTVIFTARLGESTFSPLGEEIRLGSLSDEAVRSIAIESTSAAPIRPDELDRVVERADGNPLFLDAIIRMIRETGSAESLPDSLEDVVSTEIDTLLPLPRQVLRYISVLGRSFRRVVVNALLDSEGITLDDATRRDLDQFLDRDGSERLRFRHAMVHDIAYEGLPYRKRRDLHQQSGEIIERFAGSDVEHVAPFLAHHYSRSGAHEKAWRFASMAAEEARSTYATTEAILHYRHAIDAARHLDLDSREVSHAWKQMAAMYDLAGQYEEARDAYRAAARLESSDPVALALLHRRQAEAWFGSGNLAQAKRQLTMGHTRLRGLPEKGAAAARARLHAYRSSVDAASGDPVAARAEALAAVDLATTSGEEEALARAYGVLDWANFVMGIDEPQHGTKAIEIFERLGLHERTSAITNNMGAYAYFSGKWDEAVDWYERAAAEAELSGDIRSAAFSKANIAEVLVGQRRYTEAEALALEAERIFKASKAEQALWLAQLQIARAKAGLGDHDSAVQTMDRLLEEKLESGTLHEAPELVVDLTDSLVQIDLPENAIERLDRFIEEAPEEAGQVEPGMARARGAALVAMGRADDAERELERALELATEQGSLLEEARILELMGVVSGEMDDRSTSRAAELHGMLGINSA